MPFTLQGSLNSHLNTFQARRERERTQKGSMLQRRQHRMALLGKIQPLLYLDSNIENRDVNCENNDFLLSFEPQQITSSHSLHGKVSLWRIRRHICYQCIVLPICTLPFCAADLKVKISVVFDNQLVITVAYSVTDKSSFSVT